MDRERELIGCTVRITQGQFKSHVGIVKDVTETTATVELHSKCATISVDRSRIAIIGGPSKRSAHTKTPSSTAHGLYVDDQYMHGANTPGYSSAPNTFLPRDNDRVRQFNFKWEL